MANLTRNDIAITTIVLAACFGAAHLLIGTANERLERSKSAETRARLIAENAEQNATAHARNLELSNQVRAALLNINNANQHADSAAALYDQYANLANQLGLKPNRLGPTSATSSTTPGRRTTRATTTEPTNEPIAYHAELDGNIQSITQFLDTIEQNFGHTRIINARITPIGMQTRPSAPGESNTNDTLPVRLSITTLHYRFEPPKVPDALLASASTETTP